jgi:flagellar motor switch protein FliN/FliY
MVDLAESGSSLWLCEEFARQWTHVMETMTGEAPLVTFKPHELSDEETQSGDDGPLWWQQQFSLGADALFWVGACRQSWEDIGNQILRGAGVEDGDTESIRGTYLEIVNQALSGVASALAARARQDVACTEGRQGSTPPRGQALCYSFEVSSGDKVISILAAFREPVALHPETAPPADAGKRPESAPSKSAPSNPTHNEAKPTAIDLLLDVELPVSVSFGRAQLPLKDVIKLTTGSIVELNRAVSEPVDVIVNNCVIARGEVVVVEGNFGIRIRQVISRQERLRTLY